MKQSLDIKSIQSSLSQLFGRFHTIIFFLVIGISLIFCIYSLLLILNQSSVIDEASVSHIDTNFDTQTIKRVDELKSSNSNSQFQLPAGRTNPFVE